jgi:signal transduction histidine kinase
VTVAAVSDLDEARVGELHAAFRVFSEATAALERQYQGLQAHVEALRSELEAKQRALTASIERQRCLEDQALRQSRLAAMGEMAATLAHEVRNPLGAMELFVRTLADEVADRPVACRLADQIAAGIADLNHLVTNILDYTRLPQPNLVATDLDGVLDDALDATGPALGSNVRIERRRAPGTLWPVDRGLLSQALLNVLRNAGEAMGGTGTLRVAVEPGPRWTRIVVADSGPGVPAGRAEAIFTPFFTTKERGTGLGLAVARAAVAAHGGTVALRPAARGATFVVTLPLAERSERDATTVVTANGDPEEG